MAAIKPSIKDIICLEKISFVLEKSYEMEAFVMGHHVYKETWAPFVGEKLDAVMQQNNVKDKYAVAIFQEGKKKVIGQLPLGKSGKFAKTVFYFLKAANAFSLINAPLTGTFSDLSLLNHLSTALLT